MAAAEASTTPARQRLIEAGERLFAEQGIHAVSLRQVNGAAGQRNKSAVHYHFGSKEALVAAIFANRIPALDRRRRELLAAVEGDSNSDLRSWVEVAVLPLGERVVEPPGGSHYLRFLSQVYRTPEAWLVRSIRDEGDGSLLRVMTELARRLDAVPPRLGRHRITEMIGFAVHALADLESRLDRGERPVDGERELPGLLFLSDLVDRALAGLTAPVSEHTARHLEPKGRSV